ncbi:MAG: LysR family transcriptional regulator [Hyphomicrobiaceae bacterium]|nr:LysR family transcriptional regulator [Hyphomicrobiaceae bacterium]
MPRVRRRAIRTMDIQDLRIFIRVAAVHNLSTVSTEFGLTPGTVSKRIQALEKDVGATLFDRTTRLIRITQEGETFLGHIVRVIEELEAASAAIERTQRGPRGRLKIAAPPMIAGRPTSDAAVAFLRHYPEIELCTVLTDEDCSLQEEGIDVMIRSGVLADSALIGKRLGDDPQIVVAAPCYLAEHGQPRAPADLEKHACLVLSDSTHWPFEKRNAEKLIKVRPRLRSNDTCVLHRAAIAGLGLLRTSRALVADDLSTGRLLRVLEEFDTTGDSAIWAVYPRTRHMLPRTRAFLDFITDWVREGADRDAASEVPRFDRSKVGEGHATRAKS